MIRWIPLPLRMISALLCVLLITVLMTITWGLGLRRVTRTIMQAAFRFGAWSWGVRIKTQGRLATQRPLLVVSNHFSYIDLFVLGSRIPAAFAPKIEIANWPLLGFMSRVSGCVFIDRRVSQTLANRQRLEEAFAEGDIVSLFPEGTTSDGTKLLPFKSSLFSLVEGKPVLIQPVSIIYTRLNGKPIDAEARAIVGWYGDAAFFPHVMKFLRQSTVDAMLVYHEPVRGDAFASRKELAKYCHDVIENFRGVYRRC